MSKGKHKNREPNEEHNSYNRNGNANGNNNNNNNNNNRNNNGNNPFNNTPLAQISKMIGNIDINKLAQMLSNFNIPDISAKDKQQVSKKVSNDIERQKVNVNNNGTENDIIDNNEKEVENKEDRENGNKEDLDDSVDFGRLEDKKQKIIILLKSIGNLLDKDSGKEIQEIIDIYLSK